MDRELLRDTILEALGEAAAIFTTDTKRGVNIVMPTEELVRIGNNAVAKLTTKQAMDTLTHALKTDEGYYEAWKANIAMAFKDECDRAFNYDKDGQPEKLKLVTHSIANNAAKNFLDLLIYVQKEGKH